MVIHYKVVPHEIQQPFMKRFLFILPFFKIGADIDFAIYMISLGKLIMGKVNFNLSVSNTLKDKIHLEFVFSPGFFLGNFT